MPRAAKTTIIALIRMKRSSTHIKGFEFIYVVLLSTSCFQALVLSTQIGSFESILTNKRNSFRQMANFIENCLFVMGPIA